MENGIVQRKHVWFLSLSVSHNPCCNGRWSRTEWISVEEYQGTIVLILIVVEDGLVLIINLIIGELYYGLNPCCSGRWSRTEQWKNLKLEKECLNPCCSGRWSRTFKKLKAAKFKTVLILVVVDDGLVLVLLVPALCRISLNPCCSGRWTCT